jgi:hypothetical protein
LCVYIITNWVSLVYFLGMLAEITGVVLMASRYTRETLPNLPLIMLTALWRGSKAMESAKLERFSAENVVTVIQGLGFVGLGFLLQSVPTIINLVKAAHHG